MRIKTLFLILALAISLGYVGSASAQTATFPAGCASGLGYSVTTGEPCNGEDEAYEDYLPGCVSALGYSTVDGRACSGGDVAISWLAGCTSIYGYSVINGFPCNGTGTVSMPGSVPPPVLNSGGSVGGSGSPGFPTTGASESLANILYLGSSALVVALGLVLMSKRSNA